LIATADRRLFVEWPTLHWRIVDCKIVRSVLQNLRRAAFNVNECSLPKSPAGTALILLSRYKLVSKFQSTAASPISFRSGLILRTTFHQNRGKNRRDWFIVEISAACRIEDGCRVVYHAGRSKSQFKMGSRMGEPMAFLGYTDVFDDKQKEMMKPVNVSIGGK